MLHSEGSYRRCVTGLLAVLALILLVSAACSAPDPTPTPTLRLSTATPTPTSTAAVPTPTPSPTLASAPTPTSTPAPTPTPTATPIPTPTPTPVDCFEDSREVLEALRDARDRLEGFEAAVRQLSLLPESSREGYVNGLSETQQEVVDLEALIARGEVLNQHPACEQFRPTTITATPVATPVHPTLTPVLTPTPLPPTPTPDSVAPVPAGSDDSAGSREAASATAVQLPLIGKDCGGYSSEKRDEFDGWASGVRDTVAVEEGYEAPPSGYHLDHNVPVADAWRSGGCRWSISKWREFYNDIGNLNYLPASVNMAKSDSGPADWAFDCGTVAQWIATKAKWGLHSDARERAALELRVRECGDIGAGTSAAPTPTAPAQAWRMSYEKNCNGRWEDVGEPGFFGRCYDGAAGSTGSRPTPTPSSSSESSWRMSYEKNCNGRWEDVGESGFFGRCYD